MGPTRSALPPDRPARKAYFSLALGTALLGALLAPARGASVVSHAPVIVGQRSLFQVGDLPGLPAAQRAAAINRRLDSFVRRPEQIAGVRINARGAERVLTVAGHEIVTLPRVNP